MITVADATPGEVYVLEMDAPEIGGHGATFFTDSMFTMTSMTGTDTRGETTYKISIHGRHASVPGSILIRKADRTY